MSVPTFLSNKTLCLAKTANGYALAEESNSVAERCLFFADLDALKAYLAENWTA